MYGWRGRIGLLVPTGNSVMEPEFARMLPEGVTAHANRVRLRDVTPASLREMEEDAARAAAELAPVRLGVMAFGCTSGSFVGGAGHEERIRTRIEQATGLPATTASGAVLRALRLLGARRISLVTPYTEEVTALEIAFLEARGFEVLSHHCGGLVEVADMQELPPERAYRWARGTMADRAEALFISCTGFRTIEIIEPLERDLGRPVVTSNQALLADSLRILGIGDASGAPGSLVPRMLRATPADGLDSPAWPARMAPYGDISGAAVRR